MEEPKLFPVTKSIFLEVSEFKGKTRVDIRKWYEAETGELRRTSKGINLGLDDWETLKSRISDMAAFVDSEKK